MTAEAIAAEQPVVARDDLLELKIELQHNLQEAEARLHRELQHYATKADLKDTELRLGAEISGLRADLKDTELRLGVEISGLRANLKDTELRIKTDLQNLRADIKDMELRLLLRLGGLIVAVITIAVAILKLWS